jgi:hypothetical protein
MHDTQVLQLFYLAENLVVAYHISSPRKVGASDSFPSKNFVPLCHGASQCFVRRRRPPCTAVVRLRTLSYRISCVCGVPSSLPLTLAILASTARTAKNADTVLVSGIYASLYVGPCAQPAGRR